MKKSLLALALFCSLSSQTALAAFDDVPETHTFYEGISYLELIGAVNPGDDFRPDDLVTRAELFKILFKTLHEDLDDRSPSNFSDVASDAWFAPYADLASFHGLADGSLFEPEKTVSRGNALGLVMQAYGLGAPIIPLAEREDLFKDVKPRHPLYSLIYQADKLGLLESNLEETYNAYEKITRGELADLIYRLENWQNDVLAEEVSDDFYKSEIFADVWSRIINDFYLPTGYTIDQDVLLQAAVDALLESLGDPYSVYFTPDEAAEFTNAIEGEFEGIGAILNQDADTFEYFITEIIEDSPAEKYGLKPGDQITAIDNVSVEGMAMEEVLGRIKGPAGTEVRITVIRDDESLTLRIVRAQITLDLVSGRIYDQEAWLIDIDSFGSDIVEDLTLTIEELSSEVEEPSAIVLDLRGNPGGYVNMGTYVASLFAPEEIPLVILDYGGHQQALYNGAAGPYLGTPVYILVDEFTASASEIAALTLQEVADATVIGTQTFGKGTAQELITYWDGSVLKITIANWLSAEGNSIQGVGLTPDILVTPEDGGADEWLKALNDEL